VLIAQLTDLHVGFEQGNPDELNFARLTQALNWLNGPGRQPDMLLLTGDLTEYGDVASYRRLRTLIADCAFPVHLCVGNHDDRDALKQVFPEVPVNDGFVQYVVDTAKARIIVLDTLDPGHHGGAFCERRAAWLSTQLDGAAGKPVLIVLHHPPIETGIPWMTTHPQEEWVTRIDAAIGNRSGVTMICGHVHRSITTSWKGRALSIAPSTAPQVALDLSPMDPEQPDGRAMIVAELPGIALHLWTGDTFVTHHATAGTPRIMAKFDGALQPFVRQVHAEHAAIDAEGVRAA